MGQNHRCSPDLISSKCITILLQLTPLFLLFCDGQSNTLVCVSGYPYKQDLCSYTSCQVPPCLQRSMMEENVTLSCLLSRMAGLVLAIYNIVLYLLNI